MRSARAWLHLAGLYWPLTAVLLAWVLGLTGCGAAAGLAVGWTLWGAR